MYAGMDEVKDLSIKLFEHSNNLEQILNDCKNGIYDKIAAFSIESDNTDLIFEEIPKIQIALKSLAMRMNRNALDDYNEYKENKN